MTFRGFACFVRWALFALYLSLFFLIPTGLLWDLPGLTVGAVAWVALLAAMRFRGSRHVCRRLGARPLSQAQSPKVFAIVTEYCRRLAIPVPKLGVIESPALNIAAFGFSRKSYWLVVTRGLVNTLSREQLAAVIGRELSYLWYRDVSNESWLAQFLATLDRLVTPPLHGRTTSKRFYPYQWIVRQLVLYPLTIVPAYLLMGRRKAADLDLKSVKITRKPTAFADGLRLIEAFRERVPFHVPLSSRHLFLLPPASGDPVGRVFFESVDLKERIATLSRMSHPVSASAS